MRKVLLFLCLLCSNLFMLSATDRYYDKHIIIVIDQGAVARAHQDGHYSKAMTDLYEVVSSILQNRPITTMNESMSRIASGFSFNENTDMVSLFSFGIPNDSESWRKLKSRLAEKYSFDKFSDELIKKRTIYSSADEKTLSDFVKQDVYNLFKNDALFKRMNGTLCTSLSHYVYPLILKYVDRSVKAKEYYLFLVSDFYAGGGSNDANDRYRINELFGMGKKNDKYRDFHTKINNISSLYSSVDVMKIVPYGLGERENINKVNDEEFFPVIFGKKILLDACLGSTSFVSSDVRLKQEKLGEPNYKLSPVVLTFAHNGKIQLEKIKFTLKDKSGKEYINKVYDDTTELETMYDSIIKGYNFPIVENLKIDDLTEGDELSLEYILYTKSNAPDDVDVPLLPYVFVAQKDYVVTDDVFIPYPQMSNSEMFIMIAIILLLLIFYFSLLWFLYLWRGKNRNVSFDFKISPISNERFMEVKDNKVINYDCWYWDGVLSNRDIRITGKYNVENKLWAKKYKYVVEYWVEDVDTNQDFSFRPGLQTRNSDGSLRSACKWYVVQEDSDASGKFSATANVFISDGTTPCDNKVPDFTLDHILKVKIKVRIKMVDDNNKVIKYLVVPGRFGDSENVEKVYSFIVKPKLQNSDLWMAFDPGTTGSCAAFGIATLPSKLNNIYLAMNSYQVKHGNDWVEVNSPVFPSKIRINKKSSRLFSGAFTAEDLLEGANEDFEFGNKAEMLWGRQNCFQSIKKLLGYASPQEIISDTNEIAEISGQDLAHLLVKGLYNHTKAYIEDKNNEVDDATRDMFMPNGVFSPQRAIVAVPNNYTLVKIQEMVDSVKRLGEFKEVHYIYESEAVMMTYLRKNWDSLAADSAKKRNNVYVVYDMGGATINATAFKLNVNTTAKNGNINTSSIDVETISKVGYGIGGDDIDYALIQMIYNAPSIKATMENNDVDIDKHQRKYKVKLIELAREIKLSWIETSKGNKKAPGIITNNIDDLWTKIYNKFGEKALGEIELPVEPTSEDVAYFKNEGVKRTNMRKFVLEYVNDAVSNLLSTVKGYTNVVLIMSGRSVLYPGVRDNVGNALKSSFKNIEVWDGFFNEDGTPNADMVKTAVAVGACWYAMYSNRINMRHNLVTTSFGYIDYVNNKETFVPVIERNMRYDANGTCCRIVEAKSDQLRSVEFVQMLGMNYDEIYSQEIKHKMNKLDTIYQKDISPNVASVKIIVDDKNNFSYAVETGTVTVTPENNSLSRLASGAVKTQIDMENSPAYVFATLNILEKDENEVIAKSASSNVNKRKSGGVRF